MENENIIIYEDDNSEEYLCEMAQFKPEGYDDDFSILVAITPENRVGECYFKVYNNPKYSSATKVARISFIVPKLFTGHAKIGGKKEWKLNEINSKTRKELIQYLNSKSKGDPDYTIWTRMRFEWNLLKNIPMKNINEYIDGKYDNANKSNPDYIPYNMQMPDYNNLK